MNDFAIETVQSLFENMLDVPQSELETTVMRFREEVKNLGEHRCTRGTNKIK